jgi:hypothetical protein
MKKEGAERIAERQASEGGCENLNALELTLKQERRRAGPMPPCALRKSADPRRELDHHHDHFHVLGDIAPWQISTAGLSNRGNSRPKRGISDKVVVVVGVVVDAAMPTAN